MFNKTLKDQTEHITFDPNVATLIATVLSTDPLTLKVLVELAKKDRRIIKKIKQNIEDEICGLTKEEIRESLCFGKKIATSGKQKGEVVMGYPAIKKIDSIIASLTGPALVYHEIHPDKKKRYSYTVRGLQVIDVIIKKGWLKKEDIYPDYDINTDNNEENSLAKA